MRRKARAFLDEAIALLPEQLRPAEHFQPAKARASHAQQGTPDAVRAALAWIPNADLDYDSWVRIGMAIKGAIGEAGAELFAAWSAQSAKNDPGLHRQDLGRVQAQQYRRRHALSSRHGARLEARSGAGARWLGAARCGASGGGVVGEIGAGPRRGGIKTRRAQLFDLVIVSMACWAISPAT